MAFSILLDETIVARSTPHGMSALGLVRLSGRDSIRIFGTLFSPSRKLYAARTNSTLYGEIISDGIVIDDIVVALYRAPRSFTGEEMVEVTCHGSDLIVQEILRLLVKAGARPAEPGEFSLRGFLHNKISLEEVEQINLRIRAEDAATLHRTTIAVKRKHRLLSQVYDELLETLALVNAEIDFGESDNVTPVDFSERLKKTEQNIQTILRESESRTMNQGPINVALIGAPNVGKSSLFNALLSYERSVVSEIAGTTRDYVEAYLDIEGRRVRLIDTAGLRDTEEVIEGRGIQLGQMATSEADIILRITDNQDRALEGLDGEIIIQNKSDLDNWDGENAASTFKPATIERIYSILGKKIRQIDTSTQTLFCSEQELNVIKRTREKIHCLGSYSSLVELAEELRGALDLVGGLLGKNISEDSVNLIFSKLCIGK